MIELPSDLHPDLVPLAFLLGDWEGAGVYEPLPDERGPGVEKCNFGQEAAFTHDGRPFLEYTSRTWVLDGAGKKVRPLENESGYWRIDKERRVEIVMARDEGVVEVWYGELADRKPQIDLATDAVARTASASDYAGGKRLYGLVHGDLMWVFEKAAPRVRLRPYMSAHLKKVPNPAGPAPWLRQGDPHLPDVGQVQDLPDDGIAFFR